jgi:hypothetical protein
MCTNGRGPTSSSDYHRWIRDAAIRLVALRITLETQERQYQIPHLRARKRHLLSMFAGIDFIMLFTASQAFFAASVSCDKIPTFIDV